MVWVVARNCRDDHGGNDGKPGNRDPKPNKVPKRDMVVKEGDTLDLGGQLLVALSLRRARDEVLVPAVHLREVGEAALGEGAQQVERRGRLVDDDLEVSTGRPVVSPTMFPRASTFQPSPNPANTMSWSSG